MNQLKVDQRETIIRLQQRGWSGRRIARELGYDRETVSKYLRSAKPATPSPGTGPAEGPPGESKPATLTPGAEGDGGAKPATPSAGSGAESLNEVAEVESAGIAAAIDAARANVSLCEVWKAEIEAGLTNGFSAKRIHEDLVRDGRFAGSYQSVKRFVRRLEKEAPVPHRRMEFAPGEQLQVDFGTGAWLIDEQGKKRRSHVFRAVLCCSRKGYSEATLDQKTETFVRCMENAFLHLGGVPATCAPDNLKAAVLHPDWFDPELNPKLASFAAHYNTVILPTKPRMPRHKGRVERGVDFVQRALKGRSFRSLAEENTFLAEWEKNVADTRIHGTTRRHVCQHFLAVEKPALKGLPAGLFPSFTEGKRSVHLDGHVEFDKSYYSVPPEYTGRSVWVRGESRLIRIYDLKMVPITVHARTEPGLSRTEDAHIHPLKRRLADRGTVYLLERCRSIGLQCGTWALAMAKHRGIEGVRVMQGLISLSKKHPAEDLERAAAKALQRAGWRLGHIKGALAEPANVVQVDFLESHPLIREMGEYGIPGIHFPS